MARDFTAPVGTTPYSEELPTPATDVGADSTASSTSGAAKEQAGKVAQGAAEAGQQVVGTAKDQAQNVAAEASRQAQDLLGQTRNELHEQAAVQQQRIASGIRSLSDELGSMAERSEQSGTASELVQQAAEKAAEVAGWLDQRDPGSLLQEVKSFARRRPGAFLAIAAGAGLAAGRLTRGAVDAAKDGSDSTGSDDASSVTAGVGERDRIQTYPVSAATPVYPADQLAGDELPVLLDDRTRL